MKNGFVQDEFPSSIVNQLDQLCDQFDELWSLQNEPSVEQFLTLVEPEHREALLKLLIPIDVEYRMRNGQTFVADAYSSLGPDAIAYALEAFRDFDGKETDSFEDDRFPVIRNYRLVERIGQGGMGTVYLAEQEKPVKRKVAIKVVKAGIHSRDMLVRFQGERQALAMMDHPNIARIIDAGSTEQGAPYFTMEWVQGKPISRFCNDNELDLESRIRLFLEVCRAVQHAHQKGIIHRDLKPSNILIDESDGNAVPKVIDFGLAKALEDKLHSDDQSALTFIGSVIGTPQYMSPEQAEIDPADFDTRTDIYSLGAVLYELLTGSPPLDLNRIQANTPLNVLNQIRNQNIPRPSSRIRSNSVVSGNGLTWQFPDRTRLKQKLSNELDWVILKALDKDRDRRYETVESLHEDLQRFLNDDPVLARPPSSTYLFRKFAVKHKVLLATAAVFVVFLTAASSIITQLYFNEKSARKATEAQIARARYFSAIGFWARNRSNEAMRALEEIEPEYRFIECRLARNQFKGNCFTINEGRSDLQHIAVLSPDGRWIASTAQDFQFRIRDSFTGEVKLRAGTLGEADPACSIAFHPNNELVAVGGTGSIQIWNIESATLLAELATTETPVVALEFSHNGKMLAAAGGYTPDSFKLQPPCIVSIWNTESLASPLTLQGHTKRINDLAFSADDSKLVSCSHDKTVRLWDVTSGDEILNRDIGSYVMSVDYHPIEDRIVTGTANNKLAMWEIENNKLNQSWLRNAHGFEGDTVECLAFSPDGTKIATGSFDRTIKIWESYSGDEIETLRGHFNTVVNVAYGPLSNRLLSVSREGVLKVWDSERQSESRILKGHTESVNAIAFSPNSRWLLSAGGSNDFDVGPGSPSNSSERPHDYSIRLWDLSSDTATVLSGHSDSVTDIEFNPSSSSNVWFVSCSVDGQILFWEEGKSEPSFSLIGHSGLPVNAISFHPNGKSLVSVGEDGAARIWDIETRSEVVSFEEHKLSVKHATWNQNGVEIATIGKSGNDASLRVWHSKTGQLLWQKKLKQVHSASFSNDASTLVTAGDELMFFDSATGALAREPVQNTRLSLYFVAHYCDPDEPRLLTGGREGQVSMWDWATMEELSVLNVKGKIDWNFVYDGKFSPDGTMVATGNRDGTVRIWDAPPYGK